MSANRQKANNIVERIMLERDSSKHDTVYCNFDQYNSIERVISSNAISTTNLDSIRVAGLDVHPLKQFPESSPLIVCQKGDVFPLAKDYKNSVQ